MSPLGLALAGIATVRSDAGFELSGIAFNDAVRFDLNNPLIPSVVGTHVLDDDAIIGQSTKLLKHDLCPKLADFPCT